jgi:hypothetical protein
VGQQPAAAGRGANKIVLDGVTGNATIPGDIAAGRITAKTSGSYGTMRCIPNTTFGESSIGFFRNGNSSVDVAGDFWAVGHHAYGPGDRNFGIGCHGSNLCLSISSAGAVNIPYSLTVGGVAVQRIPYVSCRISGNIGVGNSRGQITPTVSSPQDGGRTITLTPPHPAGASMNPQVSLISNWGDIYVNPPTDGVTLTVGTRNAAGTAENLDFYLLIL